MMDQIIIKNATKQLKERLILNNINITLDRNGVYGFFGANGSGKSMLFRAICGLIHLSSGEITVFSQKIGEDNSFPPSLGVIIDSVGLWPDFSGFLNLKFLASIKNRISDDDIRNAILRVGLDPNDSRDYKKYSLGMKQRLGIAQAIMEQPDLIILDEPTNALDEAGIDLVHKIIIEEKTRGATILIASHNKDDLDSCDRIFKMTAGELNEVTEAK